MQAIKGIIKNGNIHLLEKAPLDETEVLIIFPDKSETNKKSEILVTDAKSILDKYRGKLKDVTDEKEAKTEAAREKYESIG